MTPDHHATALAILASMRSICEGPDRELARETAAQFLHNATDVRERRKHEDFWVSWEEATDETKDKWRSRADDLFAALTPAKPGYCGCEDCIAQAAMTLAERDRSERAAVVAWLRAVSEHRNPLRMVQGDPVEAILAEVVSGIERGDYLPAPPANRETPDDPA